MFADMREEPREWHGTWVLAHACWAPTLPPLASGTQPLNGLTLIFVTVKVYGPVSQ